MILDLALRNIRLHWGRSLLAVTGVIIGVAAISFTGMLGSSLTLSLSPSFASAGDTIVVTPHVIPPSGGVGGPGPGPGITEFQVEAIREAAPGETVIPLRTGTVRITAGSTVKTVTLYAMDPADVPALLEKESGAYLRYGSDAMVGAKLAEESGLEAGDSLGIGSGDERLRIAGILSERGIGFDISPDDAVVVPDTWYVSRYGAGDFDEVVIRVERPEDTDGVMAAVDSRLNPREQVVDVVSTRSALNSIVASFGRISLLILIAGSISLAIAGVSLLNVMLMSVTERAKEVGVIRALGARRGQVMEIFLSETLIVGLLGSAAGVALSLAGGYLAAGAMLQSTEYFLAPGTLVSILVGVGFGVGVSLLSGIYPAWKAATMDPAGALRCE